MLTTNLLHISPNSASQQTNLERNTKLAKNIDALFRTATILYNLLEKYLQNGNPEIIMASLNFVNCHIYSNSSKKIQSMVTVLSKYSIRDNDLPILYFLCLSQLKIKWITKEKQAEIQLLQNSAIQKFPIQKFNANRLIILMGLSQLLLNIFYAFDL